MTSADGPEAREQERRRQRERDLIRAIALTRIAAGGAFVLLPGLAGRVWIGADAGSSTVKVLSRALGVRDALLGVGMLQALAVDEPVGGWLLMGATADSTDALATLAARSRLPLTGRMIGLVAAPATAAVSVWLASRHA